MTLDLTAALQTYTVESQELLEEMERALLALEAGREDPDLIDAIFRSAHTIKGSSGMFGLDAVVAFAHEVETLLEAVRSGQQPIDATLVTLLLRCHDHIAALVHSTLDEDAPADLLAQGDALTAQLHAWLGGAPGDNRTSDDAWHISLRCGQELFRDGMDPLSILRYLGTLGELISVTTLDDALPHAERMDPTSCYLGFEIDLKTEADKQEIDSAFEFIRESSQVHLIPPGSKPAQWAELIQALPEGHDKLGEILVSTGVLTRHELAAAMGIQVIDSPAKPLGDILVEQGLAPREAVNAALGRQMHAGRTAGERYVRVEADKLDRLVDLVGELVISSTVTTLRASHSNDRALQEAVATSSRFIEEVRDAALGLRMVPIGGTFSRFQRVVHDLSQELGKHIELVISGGETELDKTVVDRIGDPLTHLVRNAIDHAIESPEERQAAGKNPLGRLQLNAHHENGSILIELSDDGRGLDRQRIANKAIERGLIDSADGLSDQDVFQLIFAPGFSTAEQVSNLSGRGVGMDVVKRTIEDLRGTVELENRPGQGATVRLRMPLTLAIIDGFLVSVGDARYVVPLDTVEECMELGEVGRRDYLDLRGEVLPFLRLRDLLRDTTETPARQSVVVVSYAGKKAGLVVDRLLGELQTVIKPLGEVFSALKWISGCTVLDVGQVGLILDVPVLVDQAERREATSGHLTAALR
ncbi:CheA signal transduction histidine kinase [Thiorhodococcus drewsii AZ1]|uniref:Chemotaxis protein CheA n=1 Tax=Thiorhodococcus drewsii AZ1 TaxID=765913 RepID=G2DVQ1_9GAMM|nr:chemotaxis protein CheA [Thiorhodococcus drewsii]EGV34066.1 CheA signal transduction histidine kinase [Thiorhodococcus drewsii AZ1]